jgi:hypothetical protein
MRNIHVLKSSGYFSMLSVNEQRTRVRHLIASGLTERAVGSLTGLGIEDVRRILAAKESTEAA